MHKRSSEVLVVLALMALALFLRTRYVLGFGLGDDAYYGYMGHKFLTDGLDGWSPDFGSNYRFGLWVPIAASFKLLGVSDLSFALFPLASSVLLVAVVYLLGRRLADQRTAFFAALVQAVTTFDVTFATTMTIDVPVSFLLATSLLLLLGSENARTAGNLLLNFIGAFAILWAYFIKLPSPSFMLVLGIVTLLRWQHWKKHLSLYVWFGLLLGLTFLLDYRLHGDPLNYLHNEIKFAPKPTLFEHAYRAYPEWMFSDRNWIQVYLFGFHFFLGVLGSVYCLLIGEARRKALPFVLWWASMFVFLQFMPGTWKLPYEVIPRFFRYTHAFVVPASLVIGVFLGSIWTLLETARARAGGRRSLAAAARVAQGSLAGLVVLYGTVSVAQGLDTAALYWERARDSRTAALYLKSLPPKPVYCDNSLHDRFNFYTGYERMGQAQWAVGELNIQREIVQKKNLDPLRSLREGYVVFGGSRGVGSQPSDTLMRGSFEPPAGWKLIFEDEEPPNDFRKESLRIYEISRG